MEELCKKRLLLSKLHRIPRCQKCYFVVFESVANTEGEWYGMVYLTSESCVDWSKKPESLAAWFCGLCVDKKVFGVLKDDSSPSECLRRLVLGEA